MKLNFKLIAHIACVVLLSIQSPAYADIYIENSDDEISISNVNELAHYDIKIEEHTATGNHVVTHIRKSKPIAALPYHQYVKLAAQQYAIDPALIHAVIAVESNHIANAESHKGAYGLMQIMPQTSRHLRVKNKQDPKQNIMAGTQYLRELLNTFNGDMHLTLAAYNAGPATVMKYGRKIPPFKETQAYIQKVMQYYHQHS